MIFSAHFHMPPSFLRTSLRSADRSNQSSLLVLLAMAIHCKLICASSANLTRIPAASPLPIVPLCLLRCKDNHMLTMDSEWSSDFVFPLLGMLRSGDGSQEMINTKMRTICEQNSEMVHCLQRCPASTENEILQLGLQPWEGICANLRVLKTQLGCWKQNIEAITLECAFESQQLRHSTELLTRNVSSELVETICEHLRHLSVCFIGQYGNHCGPVSQRLVRSLMESSREMIAKMLRVKWTDLPAKCRPEPLPLVPMPFGKSSNSDRHSAMSLFLIGFFTIPFVNLLKF